MVNLKAEYIKVLIFTLNLFLLWYIIFLEYQSDGDKAIVIPLFLIPILSGLNIFTAAVVKLQRKFLFKMCLGLAIIWIPVSLSCT